jgi:hypothetical protein
MKWLSLILAGALLAPLGSGAQTATSAYNYALPAGWQRSAPDGIETFAPTSEQAETAQILLLPHKPMQGDFQAFFDSERVNLEGQWGLVAPQSPVPQAGRMGASNYAAYFASYDSSAGPRYLGFLAVGQNGRFGMLVFVAATADGFNRLAPQAVALLKSMQIKP